MNIRNLYLLLIGVLLISVTACKKTPTPDKSTGNVPVTPNPKANDVPLGAGYGVTL